jgi:hypothetical protein
MRTRTELTILTLILGLALVLVLPLGSQAEVAGRFTQVEGRVDLLKGGKLPAATVKVDDQVEVGDVVRTKSLSKAQITFIDNTTLTISQETRVAVEAYMFDPAKKKRNAVLEIFQGMALTTVTKIFKVDKPDFIVKTHTAIMGVRGTETGIRLAPNATTFLNFSGKACVENKFPEIKGEVCLKGMEGSTVGRNLPPSLAYELSSQDREMFMRQLTTCVPSANKVCPVPDPNRLASASPTGTVIAPASTPLNNPGEQTVLTTLNTVTVPPTLAPTTQTYTFSFHQLFAGTYLLTSASPFTTGTFSSNSPGAGVRTGVYPGTFSAAFNIIATSPVSLFSSMNTGGLTATSSGSVSGLTGQTLTGMMTMTAITSGGTTFNFSGPVTLQPNGTLSFSTKGTFSLAGVTGTTTGTFTQTAK